MYTVFFAVLNHIVMYKNASCEKKCEISLFQLDDFVIILTQYHVI